MDRLRQRMYKLTAKIQSPERGPTNFSQTVGVLPGTGIAQSIPVHIPLVGAIMGDREKAALMEWAKGAKNIPYAASMIGMMSGDAGKDIEAARTAAGPSPIDEYVPPAYKAEHPEWGAKQEQRMQEYNTRVGKELAGITGLDVPYDPMSGGKEQREIQGRGITAEQAKNRQEWLKAKELWERIKKMRAGGG